MRKIVTIVGARPQFIKTPLVSQELRKDFKEILVHTGQHYDQNMSDIFFSELNIAKPDYNLEIGSSSHGKQTGEMLIKLEEVLVKEKPDMVVIYGDTNSTLAGALVAAKLNIPIAHIEAGLRSYNRAMPEEINRIVADKLSTLLFCPTANAAEILKSEGIFEGVFVVGDVMADIQMQFLADKQQSTAILNDLGITPKEYILATVHRQENTDSKQNLSNIIEAMVESGQTIVFPLHPRTKKFLEEYGLNKILDQTPQVKLIEPLGLKEMVLLEANAKLILTDSGGVQKEAYLHQVPCITLREETEWTETVEVGWNNLAGTDKGKILGLIKNYPQMKDHPNFYGQGDAYKKIVQVIREYLNS